MTLYAKWKNNTDTDQEDPQEPEEQRNASETDDNSSTVKSNDNGSVTNGALAGVIGWRCSRIW